MQPVVSIVTDANDYQACMAIRAAAFLARGEPYSEEYDGNDLVCATHLLARQNNEPVGAMRIRIITADGGGIAVWERLAVSPVASRGIAILNALANTAKDYTLFKGCHTVIGGVADTRLIRFWKKRGFKETGEPPITYNGTDYTQMRIRLSPPPRIPDLQEASVGEAGQFAKCHAEGERRSATQMTSCA